MKRMTKLLSLALSAVLLTAAVSGCAKIEQTGGDGKTVVIGADTDLKTLDPGMMYEVYGNLVTYAAYDMLFRVKGEDMANPQPSIATEDWTLDDTRTLYTFPIREGVKFSSGNELTAKDVVFSIQRVQGMTASSNQAHVAGIESVTAPDDHTVVIKLKAPDASFLTKLASNAFCILDSETVKANGGTTEKDKDTATEWLNSHSAGSGPFVLESWTPKDQLVLTKNKDYWGETGNVEKVIIKEVPDANTQIQMLQNDEIQVALSVNQDNVATLEGKEGIAIKTATSAVCTFLMMNNDPAIGKEMANPKVQQAVRYALDYEGLKKLAGGNATLPLSIIPQGFVGAMNRPDNYQDIEKAKALMKEAGYENGFSVELTVANAVTEGLQWTTLAQKIQSDLKVIGIDVQLKTVEMTIMLDPYRKGELPFLVMYWTPDYYDINNQLEFLPGRSIAQRAKWSAEGHEDMLALGDKITSESDAAKRAEYSKELQELMAEDCPYAFLLQHPKTYALSSKLQNVAYNDLCKIQLAELSVA